MPVNISQHLKLFPLDPTDTTVQERLVQFDRLVHTTRLPGGFWTLEFDLSLDKARYFDWRLNRLLFRLRMEEDGGKVIWEGRLEDIDLRTLWSVHLTFAGYWSNFKDGTDNTDHNAAGATIVQNLRDNLHAYTDQLGTSNDDITATTDTLQINHSGKDFTAWETITNPTSGLLTFGDTSDEKVDLAVWEDRNIHYKTRGSPSVKWHAFLDNGGVSQIPASISWDDIANAVDGRYDNAGTPTLVGVSTDADSIAKWIRRERVVGHGVDVGDSTSATNLRDTALANAKDAQQRMNALVLSRVFDTNGVEWPLCRVRAGEVIRIPDFLPLTADLDATTINALTTFFIEETVCDHTSGRLTIRPDNESLSLVNRLRGVF